MIHGIATTIWQQIPVGVKFSIGARQPVGDEEKGYLHFTVGPDSRNPFKITIQLDPSDTYTVRLIRCNLGSEVETLEEASDIYCDDLGDLLLAWEGRHLVN